MNDAANHETRGSPEFKIRLIGSSGISLGSLGKSILVHLCFVLVLAAAYIVPVDRVIKTTPLIKSVDVSTDFQGIIYTPGKGEMGGGGGGGDRDKLDASLGKLPKKSDKQLAPPAAVIRNLDPKLAVEPTVVMPNVPVPEPNTTVLGDPKGVLGPPSNGTGSGGGIGSGSGGGVGSGEGPGVGPGRGGGFGGGVFRVGGGVSAPVCKQCPDPEYSEEARKAKVQGTVVLGVIIGPDGKPYDIQVKNSLGMNLDEKAIDAVRSWRFEPAKMKGKPVPVKINVEVNFRLY